MMETKNLLLLRNLFFKAFLIGLAIFIFLIVVTAILWEPWSTFVTSTFKVEEAALGKIVVNSFLNMRIIILFLFLVPAIALHIIIKKFK
ncbi:MAG: hypothetical protein Q8J84_03510 [Flavobacteriaceae bacterium]|nr:hypothetical protein [Flavobacteriaceae bacterium]